MIKEEKLTGEIANRIYDKAYANGLQKGRSEVETLRDEMLRDLRHSINAMASFVVYLGIIEGVNVDCERLINDATFNSPIGRLKYLIAKIENIARD